jgi:hypothetical protein
MNPTPALSSLQNSNLLLAILWAGFTCGTLDISAALVVYRYFGRPPMRLLHGIAAGVLVSRSFQGARGLDMRGLTSENISRQALTLLKFPGRIGPDNACGHRTINVY